MRGDVFLATAGTKTRPVVEISEPELARPLIAHLTTTERRLPTQVEVTDLVMAGVHRVCWVNLHAIESFDRNRLGAPIGRLDEEALRQLCSGIQAATGC